MDFQISAQIKIIKEEIVSHSRHIFKKITYNYLNLLSPEKGGTGTVLEREVLFRKNAAAILLYNESHGSVVLVRQFRLAAYLNKISDGMLIEVCAGQIDAGESPVEAIIRETREETGYVITSVEHVFSAYMSPGIVTEKISFFLASYDVSDHLYSGGGIDDEDIEVLELPLTEALQMIVAGSIQDAKTIMLLQHLASKLSRAVLQP